MIDPGSALDRQQGSPNLAEHHYKTRSCRIAQLAIDRHDDHQVRGTSTGQDGLSVLAVRVPPVVSVELRGHILASYSGRQAMRSSETIGRPFSREDGTAQSVPLVPAGLGA